MLRAEPHCRNFGDDIVCHEVQLLLSGGGVERRGGGVVGVRRQDV